MNHTKRRWRVLIASCMINLCIGSMYAWSVFSTPMAEYLSGITGLALTAASLSIAFTVPNAYTPFPQILGGIIMNKFGAQALIILSGMLFGTGMIIAGTTGPMAIAKMYSVSGSYSPAFLCSIVLAVIGIGLTVVYRVLQKRRS